MLSIHESTSSVATDELEEFLSVVLGGSKALNLISGFFKSKYYGPIEKAGRQDLMHMIARPPINKNTKNRTTMKGTLNVYLRKKYLY